MTAIMKTFLAKNFVRLSAADTLALARHVSFKLAGHQVVKEPFPSYVPSLQKIDDGANALERAIHAAKNRGAEEIALKNECCVTLKSDLGTLVQHVELVAQGDPAILRTVGYPIKQTTGRVAAHVPVPDAPVLAVNHGKLTETLDCIVSKSCKGGIEVQITDGDPTVEANWRKGGDGSYYLSKFTLTGLQPGTRYTLRVRCIGSGGTGPWSQYVSIICL